MKRLQNPLVNYTSGSYSSRKYSRVVESHNQYSSKLGLKDVPVTGGDRGLESSSSSPFRVEGRTTCTSISNRENGTAGPPTTLQPNQLMLFLSDDPRDVIVAGARFTTRADRWEIPERGGNLGISPKAEPQVHPPHGHIVNRTVLRTWYTTVNVTNPGLEYIDAFFL